MFQGGLEEFWSCNARSRVVSAGFRSVPFSRDFRSVLGVFRIIAGLFQEISRGSECFRGIPAVFKGIHERSREF